MVALMAYQPMYQKDLDYRLDDKQSRFSALPSRWFDDNSAYRVVIVYDGKAVGFFVLDGGQDKFNYTDNDKALLFRSMSVNPAYQGQGLASLALSKLLNFCQKHCTGFDQVVLGVNHDNIVAQKVYEKVGFVKVPNTFMGRAGEQYIYTLDLTI